ncbi:hypothetical protein [Methylobacterium sp. E-046]|uniref:hypothetical protein n=1 Tax=Methylobacterium sp. E-046 TaxID=2836576 RepID=UPI001FB9FFCB|nr:hypothetical protein [Methylobacterium sp. E-046]MCJ2102706.1 hypothetical protein [Methylobacterium sp. E-046]
MKGVHLAFKYRHTAGSMSLNGRVAWPETLDVAGSTTNKALANHEPETGLGTCWPTIEVSAGVDAFVAVAPSPDAVGGPRIFVAAGQTRGVFCSVGDKVAWAPVPQATS